MKLYWSMGSIAVSVLYKVSVPGSLMLFGEHAVLQQKQAVVTAINQRIKITLTLRSDNKINIISFLGNHSVALNKFKIIKPYDYVLTTIQKYLNKISSGFDLDIRADFASNIGFGSSAAVTVAAIAVLHEWLYSKKIEPMALYRRAVSVVHSVQGLGSGADVAASVFGGVISYKIGPVAIKRISDSLPLVAVYSGSKVPTAKVVNEVKDRQKRFSKVFNDIYNTIDACSKEAIKAIKNKQWVRLGELMDIHQGLHEALGVSNYVLSELTSSLRAHSYIYGSKISGSGLGDSVIGLGKIKKESFPADKNQKKIGIKLLEIKVDHKGLIYL